MGSLSQFLNEQAVKLKSDLDAARLREEWRRAVNNLVDQMETWLRTADSNKILYIDTHGIEKREERIGAYLVRGLMVRLGAREVRVVPISRFLVAAPGPVQFLDAKGPQGRVDITDGESRYSLYRIMDVPDGRWVVIGERNGVNSFNQEMFESIMQDLLA